MKEISQNNLIKQLASNQQYNFVNKEGTVEFGGLGVMFYPEQIQNSKYFSFQIELDDPEHFKSLCKEMKQVGVHHYEPVPSTDFILLITEELGVQVSIDGFFAANRTFHIGGIAGPNFYLMNENK